MWPCHRRKSTLRLASQPYRASEVGFITLSSANHHIKLSSYASDLALLHALHGATARLCRRSRYCGVEQMQQPTEDTQSHALKKAYAVREFTDKHASWAEIERGAPGRFIAVESRQRCRRVHRATGGRRHGATAHAVRVDPHPMFDKNRKVLIFRNIKA